MRTFIDRAGRHVVQVSGIDDMEHRGADKDIDMATVADTMMGTLTEAILTLLRELDALAQLVDLDEASAAMPEDDCG